MTLNTRTVSIISNKKRNVPIYKIYNSDFIVRKRGFLATNTFISKISPFGFES